MKNLKQFNLKNNKTLIRVISYIFFTIAAVLLLWASTIYLSKNKQIITNSTTIKPETFTELYFENHTQLPIKISQKNSALLENEVINSYSFKFTIHNLENKDMKYTYEVYILDPNKVIFDQDVVSLKNNESKTIDETFHMPNIYPRTKIVIHLIDQDQQISFWMGEKLQ